MRVTAVISDLSCPPREGLHQQSLLLMSALKDKVDLDVCCYCRRPEFLDLERLRSEYGISLAEPPIYDRTPSVLRGVLCRLPNRLQPAAIRQVLERIERPDSGIIYLEGAAAAGLLRGDIARRTVINIVDPPSHRQKRLLHSGVKGLRGIVKHRIAYLFARLLEGRLNYPGMPWNVVSESDRRYLSHRLGNPNVSAISVVVPQEIVNAVLTPIGSNEVMHAVVYADLRFQHMREAFLAMMGGFSRLSGEAVSRIRISVLGRVGPDDELADACRRLDVTFVPFVDDYVGFLAACDIIILPDSVGTGIKNRAIQGMALGRAVLGTAVAFEGIAARSGTHAMVVEQPDQLVDGLERMLTNVPLCQRLGSSGRELALENFHQDVVVSQWLRRFDDLAQGLEPR